MSNGMMAILSLAFLVVGFVGVFRGPKLRVKYAGVFGRPTAFFLFYFAPIYTVTEGCPILLLR